MQIATVVSVKSYTARVRYDDDDDYVSDDLQVLSFGAPGSGYKPVVGHTVLIQPLDNGDKIIVGNLLSDAEQTTVKDPGEVV